MESIKFRIEGTTTLLMSSSRGADPLDEDVRARDAHRKATARGKMKSVKQLVDEARFDFMLGLCMGPDGPIIPAENFEAGLQAAGSRMRRKAEAAQGLMVPEPASLEYEGPRKADELWLHGRKDAEGNIDIRRHPFIDRRCAVNKASGNKRVFAVRPKFTAWQATVEVHYDPNILDAQTVWGMMEDLGRNIGIGTYRLRFGRFRIVSPDRPGATTEETKKRRKAG